MRGQYIVCWGTQWWTIRSPPSPQPQETHFHGSHFFPPGNTLPMTPTRPTDVELQLLRSYWLANLRERQNFKQVPENWRIISSITLGCFKCRHQKGYLMDWSWWSYNGFRQCQTDGCNRFLCQLPIGSLSVAPALYGALHTFAGGFLYLLFGDHILNWLQKHSRKQEKETSATPVGRKILLLAIFL